jgi:hypothetical protein
LPLEPAHPPVTHAPFEQTSPVPHFVPHPPQFRRSTVVFVQTELHVCSPAAHPHLPAMHSAPPEQVVPQAPQFRRSLFVSTQELVQLVRPVEQPAAHAPWLQTAIVLVQVVPHAPQLFGSFERSMQLAPHCAVLAGQLH